MGKSLTAVDCRIAETLATRAQPLTLFRGPERTEAPRVGLLAAMHDRVIPELLRVHRAGRSAAPPAPESMIFPSARAVGELARIAVCEDLDRALAFVDAIGARGLSADRVLVDLIVPAALLLDTQLDADLRSALEVTLGKSLLQMLVHVLGARCARVPAHRGLVVLVAAPSERSALGIYVLEESLRGAGWHVQVEPAMSESELVGVVESVRVEAVAVSIGRAEDVKALRGLIVAVRRSSRNRDLVVLLAGSLLGAASAASLGADYFGADPRDAARWLDGHTKRAHAGQLM